MSNISPSFAARTFTPSVLPFAQALPFTAIRAKRSVEPQAFAAQTTPWTLQPLPAPSAQAASTADRQLQASLGERILQLTADRKVQIPADATIFPLYDAYRSAFNSPEVQAWFLGKGIALSTVVVKPGSVSGRIVRDGVSSVQTFTTHDGSGWWQVSAKLRAAVRELDPESGGLPYTGDDSASFSRNAILRWYAIQPPTGDDSAGRVQHELSTVDWSALAPATKAVLERRVHTARHAIGNLDERTHLAGILAGHIADKSDDDPVSLAGLQVPVSSTSSLVLNGSGTVEIGAALHAHGLALPGTAGELRNAVRWLTAALPPPPPLGNYATLLAGTWKPGDLSAADKHYLLQLSDSNADRSPVGLCLLKEFDVGGILSRNTPEALRAQPEHFLNVLLSDPVVLLWGRSAALNQNYHGASGTLVSSAHECAQWVIAAIKLQIDPDAPGRPGMLAGYDIYTPGNSGRTLASVRADITAHLLKMPMLDATTEPLIAHLFLASVAPEFLIRDIPPGLSMGSTQWADLRMGVAFAERQGGAGCSRAMSYAQIMALSRLDPRDSQEAAVLGNYGVDALLDWGLMQGLYAKPAEGGYTPALYQKAASAFEAQRKQLIDALKVFNVPPPSRQGMAITHLLKVFPGMSVQALQALRVYIVDPAERRNMKQSEPKTRSLVETYMTGELTKNRWMLLAPGEVAPEPSKSKSPYGAVPRLSADQQARVDKNVQALNTRIGLLPAKGVKGLLPGEVDAYLGNLKQCLSTVTRRLIAHLPLADRQALELGSVELFALREQTDGVPTLEQTPGQVEALRGRKGTLVRAEYKGTVRYFEVFADKVLIVKREGLPVKLNLGGTLQDHLKTYGPWAPSNTQLQNGSAQPFDFSAYCSDALPRPGVTSAGIIIDKLGDTLAAAPPSLAHDAESYVPDSFSSARTQSIVERIMQGNFVHHPGSVLKNAEGELPLEQKREISRQNVRILLAMIPFVGAIVEMSQGNWVEGTRGLIIDTIGALAGGAGTTLRPLVKSTQVVAPFGAKVFRVLEKGVTVISGFLNPLDGTADLMTGAAKGILAVPNLLSKAPKPSVLITLGAAEEKLRTYFGVQSELTQSSILQGGGGQAVAHNGHNRAVPVHAVRVSGHWYATHRSSGLPVGTPLDEFKSLGAMTA